MIRSWETKNMDIQWKQVWMEDEYLTADGDGLIEGSDSTVTSSPLDLDEAALSPPLSPGVLDEPVVLATLSAIADNKNGMVHLINAVRIRGSIASTLALVLDRADLALVNPVELLQDRHLGHLLNNGIIDVVNENSVLIKSWQTSSSLLHEFLGGKIHVFCDLHKPGLLTSFIPLVVLNHLLVVGIEDSPPLGKLSRGLVGLAKGPVEALEVMLGRSQPNNSQQHEESHGDPGILSPC